MDCLTLDEDRRLLDLYRQHSRMGKMAVHGWRKIAEELDRTLTGCSTRYGMLYSVLNARMPEEIIDLGPGPPDRGQAENLGRGLPARGAGEGA